MPLHLAELKKHTEQNEKIIEQNEKIIQLLSKEPIKPVPTDKPITKKRGVKPNVQRSNGK